MSSVNNNEGKILFLDAPGGTGKTFLINLLLAKVRYGGKIALAVASSGIAATLLVGG
jgi:ABC-type ATPase involved in cell division